MVENVATHKNPNTHSNRLNIWPIDSTASVLAAVAAVAVVVAEGVCAASLCTEGSCSAGRLGDTHTQTQRFQHQQTDHTLHFRQ